MLTSDLTDDDHPTVGVAVERRSESALDVAEESPVDGVLPARSRVVGDPVVPGTWASLSDASRARARKSALYGAVAGFVPFLLVLWDLRYAPLRYAARAGFASNFYEIQGRALLRGHLSVPAWSFGIEGFMIDGRTYMYFPPFPSILRMPVLLITDRLDGRMTAPSMLLAWLVLVVATAAMIWNVRLLVRGAAAVSRSEAVLYAVLLASITGGSVIVFDASLPWIYHEVYIWAAAFTSAALASLVAFTRRPTMRRAVLTFAFGSGVILTRTTSGWAICLTIVAFGLWRALRDPVARRAALVMTGGGVVALGVAIAFNWAKFRHPYMFPLEDQVWTARNARRRLALRMNDGAITGPQFFLTSLVNYFRPDGIRFIPYFPFITMPAEPARAYGGAFLDQWYRTGSVVAFMPLLFLSTLWGFVAAFRRRADWGMRHVRVPLVGALAVTGGVMFYGYVAHRYINEFLPVLMIGATVGVVDIARRLHGRSVNVKRTATGAVVALAAFGCLANTAVGITAARTVRHGRQLEQYVGWQLTTARWTGHVDTLVSRTTTLPDEGTADQLQILGDCDALYLATGDQYEPWITVQAREFHVRATPMADRPQLGALPLITLDGLAQRSISLEGDGRGRVRLRMGEGLVYLPSDWVAVEGGASIDVGIRLVNSQNQYQVTLNGEFVGDMPASEADDNTQHTFVSIPSFALPSELDQRIVGYRLTPEMGPRLDLCERLLDELDPGD